MDKVITVVGAGLFVCIVSEIAYNRAFRNGLVEGLRKKNGNGYGNGNGNGYGNGNGNGNGNGGY